MWARDCRDGTMNELSSQHPSVGLCATASHTRTHIKLDTVVAQVSVWDRTRYVEQVIAKYTSRIGIVVSCCVALRKPVRTGFL